MRGSRIAASLLRGARGICAARTLANTRPIPFPGPVAAQEHKLFLGPRRGALYSMEAPITVAAGDTGNVHVIHSMESWRNKLQEFSQPGKLVVCDFTASWCGPCKTIAPYFNELSRTFDSVLFLKVDVDEMPDVASEWRIEAMPTFVFVKEGKEVHRVVGANKAELQAKLQALSNKA